MLFTTTHLSVFHVLLLILLSNNILSQHTFYIFSCVTYKYVVQDKVQDNAHA